MADKNLFDILLQVFLYFPPFLFALCFHEYAHGWMARRKGDNTALMMGRLTLNPAAHVDVFGTLVLPLMALVFHTPFFGWAKPVPVNERNLQRPKQDMFWVALAGPLSNILLAVVSVPLLVAMAWVSTEVEFKSSVYLMQMIRVFMLVNLFLAFFNMIPLHPLDGGKVIARFLPPKWDYWMEQNAGSMSWVLIAIFLLGGFRFLAIPVQWVNNYLIAMAEILAGLVF